MDQGSDKLLVEQQVVEDLQGPSQEERDANQRRVGKQDANKQRLIAAPSVLAIP